jgi:hypothetical protein
VEVPREKLRLKDNRKVLSPPILTQPIYGCSKVVNVTGYVPQAQLDVEVDGAIVVNGFPGGSPNPFGALIPLPSALTPGEKVRARQTFGGTISDWTPAITVKDHTADYPAGPPRPELFPTPLYKCGRRTGIGNLLVGCDVTILVNGGANGSVSGANNPQGVNVVTPYDTGQHVRAIASLCGDKSPLSKEEVVQVPPSPLPVPGVGPFYVGGVDLPLSNIANGAHFPVSRNGSAMGTFLGWGGGFTIKSINPAFAVGDHFDAIQELCPADGPSRPGGGDVLPCSALPAPKVGPVQDGDTVIVLTEFVPGAQIKVFVNLDKTGDGSGPVVAADRRDLPGLDSAGSEIGLCGAAHQRRSVSGRPVSRRHP